MYRWHCGKSRLAGQENAGIIGLQASPARRPRWKQCRAGPGQRDTPKLPLEPMRGLRIGRHFLGLAFSSSHLRRAAASVISRGDGGRSPRGASPPANFAISSRSPAARAFRAKPASLGFAGSFLFATATSTIPSTFAARQPIRSHYLRLPRLTRLTAARSSSARAARFCSGTYARTGIRSSLVALAPKRRTARFWTLARISSV